MRTRLTTELSITGTAEDLDNQLPSTLAEYVVAHLELKNTLDQAKEEMAAAAKLAKAEAKKTSFKTENFSNMRLAIHYTLLQPGLRNKV